MTILTFLAMYKILTGTLLLLAAALFAPTCASAQNGSRFTQAEVYERMTMKRNPYKLPIIDNIEDYREYVGKHKDNELIDLEEYIPGIKLDIKYATSDNFTGTRVYTMQKAYLVKEAAKALKRAQRELS